MAVLNFATGVQSFGVNGGRGKVYFNPTDVSFAQGVYTLMVDLSEKLEADKGKDFPDAMAMFAHQTEQDAYIKQRIDGLFGSGVADQLFCWVDEEGNVHSVSPTALADGLPLWLNFLLAVFDTIPDATSKQAKAMDARVDKYLSKYKKYQK